MTPEAEAGGGQRQAGTQGLGHAIEGGFAVTAPVHGLLLAADGGGARIQAGVALVAFRNVRSVVGVEDLGGVLANLFEGLLLEFDLDAGLTHFHALCKKCEAYAHFPSNAQVQEWQQFAIFEITMCV